MYMIDSIKMYMRMSLLILQLKLFFLLLLTKLHNAYYIDGYFNLTTKTIYSKEKPIAGLFSPFDITPGGGEKYFLSVAQILYNMGYSVEIVLRDENVCSTKDCMMKTFQALRVDMSVDQFTVRLVDGDEYMNMYTYQKLVLPLYDVFFYIGNVKWPQIYPSGEYNIYMCQFPFDLYGLAKYYEIQRLWKYDLVLVNSRFSHEWYVRSILRDTQKYLKTNNFIPALAIAHPPIEPFITFANDFKSLPKLPEKVLNIVVLGRFFQGRQSKGHDVAVTILANIMRKTKNKNIHLYLCGYIHRSEKAVAYVESLKANVTLAGLPVTFVTNADASKVTSILQEATILWHLTGVLYLSKPREDPASFEHFGIAIVEAMYMGMIPMVTNIGGPLDIVKHKVNGFLCSTVEDYVNYVLEVQSMTDSQLHKMREKSYYSASKYTTLHFKNKLQSIISNGILSMDQLKIVKNQMKNKKKQSKTNEILVSSGQSSIRYFAVIIESGMNPLLEFTIRNIYRYLNSTFTIQIYHTILNENLIKNQVKGLKLQHFASGLSLYLQEDYENLLKSPSFWLKYQPTDKILLFNTDTYIVNDNLTWLKGIMDRYDYISAPITSSQIDEEVKNRGGSNPLPFVDRYKKYSKDQYIYSDMIFDKKIIEDASFGIGSGISVRTAGPMLKIATMFENNTDSDEPESIFFLRHMKEFGFKVADLKTSYDFAWEYEIPELNPVSNGRPFAIHSAWIFMSRKLISKFMKEYVFNDLLDEDSSVKDTLGLPVGFKVDDSKIGLLPGQVVSSSQIASSSSSPKIEKERMLTMLWDLLHRSTSYIGNSNEESTKIFKSLGISEKFDLTLLDEENMNQLKSLMKPVSSKKVHQFMLIIKSN